MTQERMLREMVEAIEVLTTVQPIVLVLEDLHWSDAATLAWLACVARRVDKARLLILGTYRPMDVLVREHALRAVKHELHIHKQCNELLLEGLSEVEVAGYLKARYGETMSFARLPRLMVQRTSGNPLFIGLLTEALDGQEDSRMQQDFPWSGESSSAIACHIPESVQQLLELQLTMVSAEDQALLETASVVGLRFSAAAVAAAMDSTVEDIETRLATLARQRQFVRPYRPGTWPAGIATTTYRFIHTLYHEVLYARVPASRRVRLQQAIAEQRLCSA